MCVSYVIDVVCSIAFVRLVDMLMCVVCAVRVGFICVCCQVEWPCGGVWVLCMGASVMCVWDYVIRVSEAALVYLFCDVVVIRGA